MQSLNNRQTNVPKPNKPQHITPKQTTIARTRLEVQRKGTSEPKLRSRHGSTTTTPTRPIVCSAELEQKKQSGGETSKEMRRTSTPEFRGAGSLERATAGGPRPAAGSTGSSIHSPGHGAIGLDAVLEAVELPAGVADLDPGLADVDADDLSHLARPSLPFLLPLLAPRLLFPWAGGGAPSFSLSSFQNV